MLGKCMNYKSYRGVKYYSPRKARSMSGYLGMDARVFVNKDSPDYKKQYGKIYTVRQMSILREEIPIEEMNTNELKILQYKAESLGNFEYAKKASYLFELKKYVKKYDIPITVDKAKEILQSMTPWEIDWDKY